MNTIQRMEPNPLSLNSSEIWAHLPRKNKVAPPQIVYENHQRVGHNGGRRTLSKGFKSLNANSNALPGHSDVRQTHCELCCMEYIQKKSLSTVSFFRRLQVCRDVRLCECLFAYSFLGGVHGCRRRGGKKRWFHTCSAPRGFIKTQRQIRRCSPWSRRFLRAFPAETGLRCTLMFPYTAHERRECSRSRRLRLLAHVSAGKEAVIPTLNLAPAYWLLQSIDNSSRKEGEREGGREAEKGSVKKKKVY